jgi:heterodisulfide reductase subunit C
MEILPLEPFKVVVEGIKEAGGEGDKFCYQCGKRDAVCPWNRVRKFYVRRIVNQANLGVVPFESEDV